MPVKLDTLEDGFLLSYEISDPWDARDLLTAYKDEQRIRDETPHTMHSMTDFSRANHIPNNWTSLRNGPGIKHPRSGEMILFGVSLSLTIIGETVFKLVRFKRFKMMRTKEEALAYLKPFIEASKAEYAASQNK